jgi:hypothetical protein
VFTTDAYIDYRRSAASTAATRHQRGSQVLPNFRYTHWSATSASSDGDARARTACINPMEVPFRGGSRDAARAWYVDLFVRTREGWRMSERVEEPGGNTTCRAHPHVGCGAATPWRRWLAARSKPNETSGGRTDDCFPRDCGVEGPKQAECLTASAGAGRDRSAGADHESASSQRHGSSRLTSSGQNLCSGLAVASASCSTIIRSGVVDKPMRHHAHAPFWDGARRALCAFSLNQAVAAACSE